MKKFYVLLIMFFMSAVLNVSAEELKEASYCVVPKSTGNSASKVLSNVTGANFLSTKAAELAIQKSIKGGLGSNVNVEIYPYTLGSLVQGKFKKLTINSKSLNLDGLNISKFKAETVCDYNQVGLSGENIIFKENFVMLFTGEITNSDLEKTMTSSSYLGLINSAKISAMGQTLFKVSNMNLSVKDSKLNIIMKLMSPIMWGMDQKTVSATSGLQIKNGKIYYKDLKIRNTNISNNLQPLLSLINLTNPFTFEINLTKDTTGYTSVKNVIMNGDKIQLEGILFVPKNG